MSEKAETGLINQLLRVNRYLGTFEEGAGKSALESLLVASGGDPGRAQEFIDGRLNSQGLLDGINGIDAEMAR